MLMKNNFQSKAVPRGTRTIWRYLSALFILFTFAIGNVWGTATNFHTFVAAGDTIIDIEGTSTPSAKMTAVNGTDWAAVSTSAKNNSIYRMNPSTEEVATSKTNVYGTKLGSSAKSTYKVTGVSNVIFYVGTSSAGRIAYLDVTENGKSKVSEAASVTLSDKNNSYKMSYTLDPSKSYTLEAYASSDLFCYAVKFTVASKCTKPGTPTALAAGSVTHNSASLSWTAGANNDGHKIYIEKKSDKTKVLDWTDATSPYAASGLDPETTYTFKVKAKGATGYCDLGDEASADFATDVDPSATTYKVTLVPAGGTISDATGWTLNAGNYEKEVSAGSELTLPTFTKTNRTFKTWRKAGPTDVASPITVSEDVTLTAVWNATVEQVLYSWEGAEGGATEVGGTAATAGSSGTDNYINIEKGGYYCLQISGGTGYDKYVEITLSGEEKVKTGDKIKYLGFYYKDKSANARPKMRDGNSPNAAIFDDGTNLPNLYDGTGSPAERTFTVPADINTNKVQITRSQTGSNTWIPKLQIIRPTLVEEANLRTVTFNYNDGGATANKVVEVVSGATVSAEAVPSYAHHRFHEWQLGDVAYDFATVVTSNITLVADWTQLYTVTYAKGEESATGDAPTQADKAATETFKVAANTFELAGKVFDHWNDGTADYNPEDTYTVGTSNVTLTAIWRTPSTMYAITKGAHGNGDFTIDPASQEAGEVVTLEATPDDGYLFGAWEVVKTEDASATGITVDANGQFTMPGYAVTVNATFVADPRKKVLYVTKNNEETTKASDKLYEALKDIYNVKIVGATFDGEQSGYDLIVLHESIDGSNYGATAVAAAKTGNKPVLNTKSYFYNNANTSDQRWNWGTPNAGQSVKGATQNSAYCNIADHPLFDGLTITDGFFEITDEAAAKCMQPVGSFTSGKEGYTLATTPNSGEGNGCAIHELTPAQRGASAGKYLMISVSNDKLNALNANGQKLFQNAAAYLIGSASWAPISVPTAAEVTATPSENYTEGNTITLTASATGTTASTTYTWYKGADWATASATTPVQAAATDGNVFTKTAALEDAGTYWCNISNGTSCDVQASVTITVSSASTPTHAISYDNTKGADMTAYPTEYTEGVGVASFAALADIAGWHFVEWSPASIAADATTDQTITAVWAQVFEVTFDLQGHGAAIAAQNIVSGGKVTKPDDPIAIGWDFGGWFTDAECTAGNEFDFNTPITVATPLYAKWTAFDGCTLLVPATSGENAGVGDAIVMQTGSKGATMTALAIPDGGSLAYTANGLAFNKKSGVKTNVVLNNDMKVGTKISLKLVAGGDKTRGLFLYTKTGTKIEAFTCWVEGVNPAVENEEETFTYTVVADDGLEGTNEFQLWRNNTVYLKQLAVTECGAAVVYHNLTSAVDPAGKGTVTLDASSVREGLTTKATYSDIDPLYEFVSWSVSGAGASIADASANPATITVGTEDAVVTLNLQLIPVKYTVNYFDGTTPMGTEQVAVNEHPTASEIETAKRHYTFLGWSLTDGGDIVALNTITRTEATTVDLFAKYEPVACPVSGTIFSMESDEAKKPGETVTIAKDASIDLAEYATISGGNAMIINSETSGKDAISTDGEFLLKATKEVMKIELNCVLQEGDIIRIPDNSAKLVISTSNAKTGTYQAFADKNTHEFAVTAAWAGVDDIYVLYDGSSLKFTKVYVIRPAKYDVSFNMMGHGSAIADLENVIEGSKIAAPSPAPTDADYSFAGWYKENTLENEWKFDVDVVETNTTLYAKWLDKSDATLKSLKYGETEIALEAGVYTYNVSLPAFTSAVPALTAETSNPNATKVIANAAAFDSEGNATSTVTVTPEVGADQVYYVNFAKGVEILLQDVTGSITWNFANAVTANVNITGTPQVLANYGGVTNDNTFESDKLEASGEKFTAGNKANLRANYIHFHTTVPGMLTISYSNTGGSNPARYIYVNGAKYDEEGSANTTPKGADNKVFVPAGDVELVMKEGEDVSKNVQIYQMIFNATPDYTRPVTEGRYGTICLPNGGVMTNATIYTLAYFGETSQKFFFDEVLGGVMEAGKPYLFLPEQGVTELKVFYTDSETKAAQTVNGFVGFIGADADDYTQVPANDNCYIISNNLYRQVQTGAVAYILSNRAYIDMTSVTNIEPAKAPGARRIGLGVQGKDQAQGFENIETGDAPMKVMINGTMYILRGEKVYDATGRLVK